MGVTMLVQLYTSRVVLNALGVEDYGIYNIVGSFIVAFTFISGPLGTATQRFLNFEMGKGNTRQLNTVFNLSFYTYLIFALIIFFIVEIAGLWYIQGKMQLPAARLNAAFWAFHFSVFALLINLIKTPFESLIIAHEKMSFYAYLSIVEVFLKLANAFSLQFVYVDKLKLYSVNLLIIAATIFVITFFFCRRFFKDTTITRLKKIWDAKTFKSLLGFSGWSLFGSVASMSANQGINILLNYFFGVIVNAAMGIANQVSVAVNQFVSSFQVAFRPQLVKYYAEGNLHNLRKLILNTSKYSYLLLFTIICPICFNMPLLLKLWLKFPPKYAVEFSIMILMYALLESLSAPMWMTVQATGKIKAYQLTISSIMFLNIILSYAFLATGFTPTTVLIIKCFLDVAYLVIRLLFIKKLIGFSIKNFLFTTILPLAMVTAISISILLIERLSIENDVSYLVISSFSFFILYLFLTLFIVLKKDERVKLYNFISSRIGHNKNERRS